MILKVKYFCKEQSVFMDELHKMVLVSQSDVEIVNWEMHLHYCASKISAPILQLTLCAWICYSFPYLDLKTVTSKAGNCIYASIYL